MVFLVYRRVSHRLHEGVDQYINACLKNVDRNVGFHAEHDRFFVVIVACGFLFLAFPAKNATGLKIRLVRRWNLTLSKKTGVVLHFYLTPAVCRSSRVAQKA